MDYNAEFESPASFWKWSAYALVASTLRNNFYHNAGNEILYPNIYVLLLADSAAYRKGGPFPLVTELAQEVKITKVYDGRASIQAILEKLSQDIGTKGGIPIRGGSVILLAEELAAFFVADQQLIPLITNVYRSRKLFNYDLRGNAFVIKDLCVTLLSASNETNLRDVYNAQAAYGGLLGRTFLIKPDKRRPPNSLLDINSTDPRYDKKPLIDSLKEIAKLKGQVVFSQEAKTIYNIWYKELYNNLPNISDPAGVLGRMHTGVLKLSLVIAASNYSNEVTREFMEIAIEETIALKPNYEAYIIGTGSSPQANVGSIFLQDLWTAAQKGHGGKLNRRAFLLNNWNQVSVEDLDKLLITLVQAGMITEDYSGNELGYLMTQKCKEKFEKTNKATP